MLCSLLPSFPFSMPCHKQQQYQSRAPAASIALVALVLTACLLLKAEQKRDLKSGDIRSEDLSLTTTQNTDWSVKQAFFTFRSSTQAAVQDAIQDGMNRTAHRYSFAHKLPAFMVNQDWAIALLDCKAGLDDWAARQDLTIGQDLMTRLSGDR